MTEPDIQQVVILDRITDVSSKEWNALLPADANPFLRHEFLSALEETVERLKAKKDFKTPSLN